MTAKWRAVQVRRSSAMSSWTASVRPSRHPPASSASSHVACIYFTRERDNFNRHFNHSTNKVRWYIRQSCVENCDRKNASLSMKSREKIAGNRTRRKTGLLIGGKSNFLDKRQIYIGFEELGAGEINATPIKHQSRWSLEAIMNNSEWCVRVSHAHRDTFAVSLRSSLPRSLRKFQFAKIDSEFQDNFL